MGNYRSIIAFSILSLSLAYIGIVNNTSAVQAKVMSESEVNNSVKYFEVDGILTVVLPDGTMKKFKNYNITASYIITSENNKVLTVILPDGTIKSFKNYDSYEITITGNICINFSDNSITVIRSDYSITSYSGIVKYDSVVDESKLLSENTFYWVNDSGTVITEEALVEMCKNYRIPDDIIANQPTKEQLQNYIIYAWRYGTGLTSTNDYLSWESRNLLVYSSIFHMDFPDTAPELVSSKKAFTISQGEQFATDMLGLTEASGKHLYSNMEMSAGYSSYPMKGFCTLTFGDGISIAKRYNKTGVFKEKFIVTDTWTGLYSSVTVTINVIPSDKIKPVIKGIKNITTTKGIKVNLLKGVSASDNIDGDLTSKIKVSTTDFSKVGRQKVTYTVTDKAGNKTTKTATLIVKNKKIKIKASESTSNNSISYNSKNSDSSRDNSSSKGVVSDDFTKDASEDKTAEEFLEEMGYDGLDDYGGDYTIEQ